MELGEIERLVQGHGGVLTTREAREAGLTRSALAWARRQGVLRPLRRGALTTTRIWSRESAEGRHRLMVLAHQRVIPELVACGLSAAVVLRLPVPRVPSYPILVRPRHRSGEGAGGRHAGMLERLAWLRPEEVSRTAEGILVTSPVRTVLDCARALDLPWGLAIGDAAVARPDLGPAEVIAAAADRCGVTWGSRSKWVAGNVRPGVESPLESLARAAIVLAGCPEPTVQAWVETAAGMYRADLLDRGNRVITEADGKVKYSSDHVIWREKRREDALREAGFEVVRFTMADHHHSTAWLAAYHRALARAKPV